MQSNGEPDPPRELLVLPVAALRAGDGRRSRDGTGAHQPPHPRAAGSRGNRNYAIALVERPLPDDAGPRAQSGSDPPLAIARRQPGTADSPPGPGPPMSDLAALTWQTMSGSIALLSPRKLDFDGQISS